MPESERFTAAGRPLSAASSNGTNNCCNPWALVTRRFSTVALFEIMFIVVFSVTIVLFGTSLPTRYLLRHRPHFDTDPMTLLRSYAPKRFNGSTVIHTTAAGNSHTHTGTGELNIITRRHSNASVHSSTILSPLEVPDGFSECEARFIGWGLYQEMFDANVTICDGFTRIICPTLPRHSPRRALLCVVHNLIEMDMEDGAHWLALCRVKLSLEERNDFFGELSSLSPLRSNALHINDNETEWPRLIITAQAWPSPPQPFTYVVTGDCSTGSPGHCIADPHNLFITQHMLGVTHEDTRVILHSGFGDSVYADIPTFVYEPDWQSLADYLAHNHSTRYLLPLAAFSALGMHGPHWRSFKGHYGPADTYCQGKSQVLLGALKNLQTFLAPLTAWNICATPHLPVGVTVIQGVNCSAKTDWQPGQYILWIARAVNHRNVLNENEVLSALATAFPNRAVLSVNLGSLSYSDQYSIVQGAHVIVGMHGGALWNAARWMNYRYQQVGILEILPVDGPGSTCPMARMMNIEYATVVCAECLPSNAHNGNIPPVMVTDMLSKLLEKDVPRIKCQNI
jgi:hypothetical protein